MAKKNSTHAHELGHSGEESVYEALKNWGYDVEYGPVNGHDLEIENCCTVEIKTAELSDRTDCKAKRWQFCLYPHPGCDKPFNEDVLILRCESAPPCHFIIPGFLIREKLTKIDITSEDPWKYRGKWAVFREEWEFLRIMAMAASTRGTLW